MANRKPSRERILDSALTLFNDRRFAKVTTAQIANHCDIAEGNLWYHFNDREALLEGLFQRFFDTVTLRLQVAPSDNDVLADYATFYLMMADELNSFRFFYRDQRDYESLIGNLSDRLPTLYLDTANQFKKFMLALRDKGHLDLSDDKLASITTITIMIFRYAAEFTREANIFLERDPDRINYAFQLHLSLYEDRLSVNAKSYLEKRFALETMRNYLL
ncbi:MAG: TetR/AcrR family transcriptional regulator [Pseudomonadota bacterium]